MAQPLIDLRLCADGAELARTAAEEFSRRAGLAIGARERFAVALSGGSTPRRLFALLAARDEPFRDRIDWRAVHLFWGDERHVPPDHPESNFRMTRETLLDAVPIPAANIHRIRGEEPDAARAAALYEDELRAFFLGDDPRFDLVLLGLGPDAHTASLFPGSDAVRERERWVVAPWVEKLATFRITLTPAALNRAAAVIFLVQGEEKAAALHAVFEGGRDGERDPDRWPAQVIRPENGEVVWLVDRAAASGLEKRSGS
ncbi:MAG TPA: 6-phosphogluconolactonase [Thermoanaerobaculia bacterium]|nr:6-phosphogluconolactonase [Thermoanaerobaculia bacterium]